jgi:minor curlin subunit
VQILFAVLLNDKSFMKKIILTVAALLAGGFVFAQNSVSTIVETGDHSRAIVTQAGTHTSSVLQKSNATSVADENLATITQTNIPVYNTTGNSSLVEQHGNSHIITVIQIGDNALEAYIGSDGSFVDANTDNETFARQNGVGNDGEQYIRGGGATKSKLTLNQGGLTNSSTQIASWAVSSKGTVSQAGNSNGSWQQVDGTKNEASTTQLGDDNYSFQWIENGGSSDNRSNVLQAGNRNTSGVLIKGDDNVFSLSQIGNDNVLVGITGGIYSNAEQIGDGNSAVLTQTGDENEFWVEQTGNDNKIKGTTLVGALQLGTGNKAIFSQNGDENTIISNQVGHNNFEKVIQTGEEQNSITRQTGVANVGNISQGNH